MNNNYINENNNDQRARSRNRNRNGHYNNGLNNSFDEINDQFRNQYNNGGKDYDNGYDRYYNNNNYYNNYYLNPNQDKREFSSAPPKKKKKVEKIIFPIIIFLVILIPLLVLFFKYNSSGNIFFVLKKTRTFMIYMVGSDLESKNKQGTYSISDIVGDKIDLEHNNVVLMVGGSKKWHNFVDSDEIGIYELTSDGFAKRKSYSLVSMGISDTLSTFLDYVYEKYPAKKFDMIFWNHGLGAMGVEQDEIANDYLSIQELDNAFTNSKFANKKLELTIFYNCLSSNLHIANIMSKYSDYMVASEEVFYLSKVLNRLNFLEKVKVSDDAYRVAYYFIEQSDKVVNAYNSTHTNKIDSTLSILDLSKMEELNNKINSFVRNINVNSNYSKISTLRRSLFTYGRVQTNDYDTVDLYQLVSALTPISSNSKLANDILRLVDKTVMYTSNLNDHSYGLSIYFPFYGSDRAVDIHLNSFKKLWNDSYYSFINDFYQIRRSTKVSVRAKSGNDVNMLTNHIRVANDIIELELTDEEKEKYRYANIYVFDNDSDKYELLLKSDKVFLEGNYLRFTDNNLLEEDGNYYTFSNLDRSNIFGELSDFTEFMDVIFDVEVSGYDAEIIGTLLDSGNYPLSGLVEYDEYELMKLAKLRYDLLDGETIREDWKETEQRKLISVDKDNLETKIVKNTLPTYYVLIELYDENNDIYYSHLEKINQ